MIALGGALALFGATGGLGSALTPLTGVTSTDEHLAHFVRITLGVSYAILAAVGIWWTVLFNRASAKSYFASKEMQSRPVGVTAIGWYLLITGSAGALGAVLHAPALVFGWVATDWSAFAVYSVFTAVQIALGAGLLRLEREAWVWAIVYFCVLAANGFSTIAFPGALRELQLQAYSFLRVGLPAEAVTPGIAGAMVAGVVALLPVWLLVRQKDAFRHPPSAIRS